MDLCILLSNFPTEKNILLTDSKRFTIYYTYIYVSIQINII